MNNPFEDISPELWLMLACASNDTTKIQKVLHPSIHWDTFMQLSVHHRVYPIVYKKIKQLNNPVVSRNVLDYLQQKYQWNAIQSLTLAGETVRMVNCFESHGVRPVVLKGAPLAWSLYGDISSRASMDIDILVEPDKLKKVQAILENEGYCSALPEYNMNSRQLQILYRPDNITHFVYHHSEKDIILELHWGLGNDQTMPAESDIKRIEMSGSPIPVLSDEKHLMYLMLHGSKHAWSRLRWLIDIAKFIQVVDISWGSLKMMVESSIMKSFFYQGLILANRLLDVPVPPVFQSVLKHDTKAWRLACLAMNTCMAITDNEISSFNDRDANYYLKIYNAQLRVGWKNKLKHILDYFKPNQDDIKLITLPNKLYFLYFVIRPLTLIGRCFRRLFT